MGFIIEIFKQIKSGFSMAFKNIKNAKNEEREKYSIDFKDKSNIKKMIIFVFVCLILLAFLIFLVLFLF